MATEAIECCAPFSATALSDAEAEATAALFRAFGDPARVRIVNMFATAGAEVWGCDLTGGLDVAQPTVSHHLTTLAALHDVAQRAELPGRQ